MTDLENYLYEQELEASDDARDAGIHERFVCACGQRQRVSREAIEYPDGVTCEVCGQIMREKAARTATPPWLRSWLDNNAYLKIDHTKERA